MGQIFDRIKRIVAAERSHAQRTEWADQSIDDMLNNDDDELRRIIDELRNSGSSQQQEQSRPTSQSSRHTTSIPPDVMRAHTMIDVRVGAPLPEIRAAYVKAIAQWHPDKFASSSTTEQDRAKERSQEINAAYIVLKAYYG